MIDANPGPYARRAAQKKPYGFKTSELCSRVQWSAIQSNQRNTLGPVEIFYSGTRTLPRAKNPEELRILKLLKASQKGQMGCQNYMALPRGPLTGQNQDAAAGQSTERRSANGSNRRSTFKKITGKTCASMTFSSEAKASLFSPRPT